MTEKKVMKLASEGKRFGAFCIDAIVPFVVYLIFVIILAAAGAGSYNPGYGYGYDYGYDLGYYYGSRLGAGSAAFIAVLVLMLIAYLVVECIFYAKGKSIGKALVGLQVVSSFDGRPFGFWKMMLRECIVKNASDLFMLGYIWILIDEKNRGWHDKILDSYVVDLKESEKMNHRNELAEAREISAETAADAAASAETSAEEPAVEVITEAAEEPVTTAAVEEAAPAVSMEIKKSRQ